MTIAILERLDQAILDVIDNTEETQQTAAIGTLFWQTLKDRRFAAFWVGLGSISICSMPSKKNGITDPKFRS